MAEGSSNDHFLEGLMDVHANVLPFDNLAKKQISFGNLAKQSNQKLTGLHSKHTNTGCLNIVFIWNLDFLVSGTVEAQKPTYPEFRWRSVFQIVVAFCSVFKWFLMQVNLNKYSGGSNTPMHSIMIIRSISVFYTTLHLHNKYSLQYKKKHSACDF